MLLVALAISIVVSAVGLTVATRAALRLRRQRVGIGELVAASKDLTRRTHELGETLTHTRAEAERLRALTQLPS